MRSSAHSLRRHFLEVRTSCDDASEDVPELRIGLAADLTGVPRLDVGDDLVAEPDLIQAACGREDQLRPPVRRIRAPLDIPEVLELVDESPDDLLVAATELRQLSRPN